MKRILFRVLAVAAPFILLLAAEAALRTYHYLYPSRPITEVWTEPDSHMGFRLRRDFHTPGGRAYINAEGIRGDSAHVPSAEGEPRILVLGNSCAFGAGALDTEVFTYHLERRLRESGFPRAWVFNAGVGGYNSGQCRVYLERELWRFRPTHILVYAGWNDLVTSTWPFDVPNVGLGPAYQPEMSWHERALDLAATSHLFRAARARWRGLLLEHTRADSGRDTWNEYYVSRYRENLVAISDAAKERGVQVHFCLLPYDHARYPPSYSAKDGFKYSADGYRRLWLRFQEVIRGVAGESRVIDLPAAVAGREAELEIFPDYNHLGAEGNRLAAEKILETMMPSFERWRTKSGSEANPLE